MLNSKEFCLIILLTISIAKGQYFTTQQVFQDDVFDDLIQQPTERSFNYLSVQLPQSKPEPVVNIKPYYMPIPLKDGPFSYQANQPNLVNYMSQQSTPSYQQTQPNNLLYSNVNVLPSKYPFLLTTNKVSHLEYPNNMELSPPRPIFVNNPAPQLPQNQQNLQNFNFTHSLLMLLPQLMNELTYYSSPLPQQEILADENDSIENIAQFRDNKANTIETNMKPIIKEPNIAVLPETTIFNTNDFKKPVKTTKPSTEADTFLLNLLQKLNSRKRVQERLGAVYLRDTLLNRK